MLLAALCTEVGIKKKGEWHFAITHFCVHLSFALLLGNFMTLASYKTTHDNYEYCMSEPSLHKEYTDSLTKHTCSMSQLPD